MYDHAVDAIRYLLHKPTLRERIIGFIRLCREDLLIIALLVILIAVAKAFGVL